MKACLCHLRLFVLEKVIKSLPASGSLAKHQQCLSWSGALGFLGFWAEKPGEQGGFGAKDAWSSVLS